MIRILFASAVLFFVQINTAIANQVRLAVTSSFHNSGLSDHLIPHVETDLKLDIQLVVVGTGQAIKLGQNGDVDAILVHSKPDEEEFVKTGFAKHRRQIMFNEYVILGPSTDPANIRLANSLLDAFRRLSKVKTNFVSRGDLSGTHKKEIEIWKKINFKPEKYGKNYLSVGSNMGKAINIAVAFNAYILSDKATWLNHKNKGNLIIQFEGDQLLHNQYSFLPISKKRHSHIKSKLVEKIEDWLVSEKSKNLINSYIIENKQVFTFNAN
jgi:tungstate transport system substrate-binding protein